MARYSSRSPYLVSVLFVTNIILLLFLFSSQRVQKRLWGSEENKFVQQLPDDTHLPDAVLAKATVTVTKTVTTTEVIEPVRTPAPAKPPGPAFCDACGPNDDLCTQYGEHNLARSRAYEGANARFHRVITNALSGKPTKIGILGGSVTKGHGLKHGNIENWTVIFLEGWKKLFPNSATTLINGAVAATGSDYYSMCFGEHIDEDVDLVIIELLINDQRLEKNAIAYEWLIRGLLDLPKSPAVINLHTIGLSFDLITTGGDLHTPVAEYYDSPVISVRNMLAPQIFKNSDLDEYYFTKVGEGKYDWRHVNLLGHKVMGDLLVAYTQRQICAVERAKVKQNKFVTDGTLSGTDGLETIPRLRLFQRYDRETITSSVKPTCQSMRTTKHPLKPIEAKGWERWVFEKMTEKPYLRAVEPGSFVKFEVIAGVMGRVRITYLRSKTFGLGDVWCWLDDDRKSGIRISSWWDIDNINVANVHVVSDKATPGKHILTCEVMEETKDPDGGHEFRLIAVDAS